MPTDPPPSDKPLSPLTGQFTYDDPALQWSNLGFAVHPLKPGGKVWVPEYRVLSIEKRIEQIQNKPANFRRIGVEPGSLYATVNYVVIDDDSHKPKYNDDQRVLVSSAIDLALPGDLRQSCPQETTPSGGRHYYLRNVDNIQINNVPLSGMDIIGSHNVACWPTEGYEFVVPFPRQLDLAPALSLRTYNELLRLLKPAKSAVNTAEAIRDSGRNNHARNLLWKCCSAALRMHQDLDLARSLAEQLWADRLAEMIETLDGESPSAWSVNPVEDFKRAWKKALAVRDQQNALGFEISEDGILTAMGKRNRNDPLEPMPLLSEPINAIWRSTVYPGKPSNGGIFGTKVEMLDGRSFFLADEDSTYIQVTHALKGVHLLNVPNANYAREGYNSQQALQVALKLAASGESYAMPTGIWWKHEFPVSVRDRLPKGDWAFYGNGVIDPQTGELDEGTPVTPITGEQVWKGTGQTGQVPWDLGPRGNPSEVPSFLRTAAGFQRADVAAQACCLAALGLIRGWFRGSNIVGKSQPFVSVEGPAGAGKSNGIFSAMYGLAGARSGLRSEPQFAIEMTQSRCATLLLDDVDIDKHWMTLIRLQQNEGSWSKTNALRELLGLMVVSSQGFDLINKDQALQDRVMRIMVPNIVHERKSLIDPSRSQAEDLWQIAPTVARKHQAEFTKLVVRACGMVDVDEAVKAIHPFWVTHKHMAVRSRLIYTSAEIALRIYIWIAQGAIVNHAWWTEGADTSFLLDDGSSIDLIDELHNPQLHGTSHFEDSARLRRATAPLYQACERYLKERPECNLDTRIKDGMEMPTNEWFRHYLCWIYKGRLSVRSVALAKWAQAERNWPDGIRRLLFERGQIESDLDARGATAQQVNYGVQYRRLSKEETDRFLEDTLGWGWGSTGDDGMPEQAELDL